MTRVSTVGNAAVAALIAFALGGCMTTTPKWDQTFGESLNRIKAAQTLHPVITEADAQPESMDAAAAVRAQNEYLRSFDTPPEPKSNDRAN